MALEHFADRAHRWPALLRMFAAQPIMQGPRTPMQVAALQRQDRADLRRRRGIGVVMRRPSPVMQTRSSLRGGPLYPLVTRRAAHPKPFTQRRHRKLTASPCGDKRFSFVHSTGLFPGHRAVLLAQYRSNL